MKHVFTAGAYNPETKTAGYAVMVTEGGPCDEMSAEGNIKCEGSPDACAIELDTIDIASHILKMAGIGSAMLHPTHPLVTGGLQHMRDIRPSKTKGSTAYTDFGDGTLFALDDGKSMDPGVREECAEAVREAAVRQAGMNPFCADEICRRTGNNK